MQGLTECFQNLYDVSNVQAKVTNNVKRKQQQRRAHDLYITTVRLPRLQY